MLRKFRKSKVMKNIILWLVIGVFILFVFVAWGSGKISGGSQITIAKIGGEQIDVPSFEKEYYAQLDMIRDRMGNQPITKGMLERMRLPERILQSMEYSIILRQIASKFKLKVTDKELVNYIERQSIFQKNGVFVGPREYQRRVISLYRMSVPQFEKKVREIILERKLRAVITAGVRTNKKEVEKAYRLNNEKYQIEYVYYPYEDITVKEPSEDEIREYFKKNKEKYIVPEKREGDFVEISAFKLKNQVTVTPKEIREYYSDNKDIFSIPEKYSFYRILVKSEDQLKKVQEELTKGISFQKVAKKYSKGKNAEKGGYLKDVSGLSMSPEERQWLSKAEVNQISQPIKVKNNYEILKLDGKTPITFKKLDEVKTSIESRLKIDKAYKLASSIADKIYRDAKKSGLEKAAKKYGYTAEKTDFAEKGEPVKGDPTGLVSTALFTMEKGGIGGPFKSYSGYLIVQLRAIQPLRQGKYEEFAEKIKDELIAMKKKNKAMKILEKSVETGNFPKVAVHKKEIHSYSEPIEGVELDYKTYEELLDSPLGKWSSVHAFKKGAFVFRIDSRELDKEKMWKELPKFRAQMLQREKDNFYRAFLQKESSKIKIGFNRKAFEKARKDVLGK